MRLRSSKGESRAPINDRNSEIVDAHTTQCNRDIERRRNSLYQVLESEDDLGVVLRAHVHIEHELREFVLATMPKPQHVTFSGFDDNHLVDLVLALGLNPELKSVLSSIGKLRNRFAHDLETRMTAQEANNLYEALAPRTKLRCMRHTPSSSRRLNTPIGQE
jgi:hypothetical protein